MLSGCLESLYMLNAIVDYLFLHEAEVDIYAQGTAANLTVGIGQVDRIIIKNPAKNDWERIKKFILDKANQGNYVFGYLGHGLHRATFDVSIKNSHHPDAYLFVPDVVIKIIDGYIVEITGDFSKYVDSSLLNIQKTWIVLESEQFDAPIFFSTGESRTSPEIQTFDRPFTFDRSMTIRTGIYIDGTLKDDMSEQTFLYHQGVNKTINLLTPFSQRYPAEGKRALIDGITGSENHRDGHWQGFDGEDMTVVIDLESRTKLKQISVSFLQNTGALIFLPSEIQIAVSNNGEDFEMITVIKNDVSQRKSGGFIKEFLYNFPDDAFRYLRFYAKSIGVCPDWHPNAGEKCWIFADEIILR